MPLVKLHPLQNQLVGGVFASDYPISPKPCLYSLSPLFPAGRGYRRRQPLFGMGGSRRRWSETFLRSLYLPSDSRELPQRAEDGACQVEWKNYRTS